MATITRVPEAGRATARVRWQSRRTPRPPTPRAAEVDDDSQHRPSAMVRDDRQHEGVCGQPQLQLGTRERAQTADPNVEDAHRSQAHPPLAEGAPPVSVGRAEEERERGGSRRPSSRHASRPPSRDPPTRRRSARRTARSRTRRPPRATRTGRQWSDVPGPASMARQLGVAGKAVLRALGDHPQDESVHRRAHRSRERTRREGGLRPVRLEQLRDARRGKGGAIRDRFVEGDAQE